MTLPTDDLKIAEANGRRMRVLLALKGYRVQSWEVAGTDVRAAFLAEAAGNAGVDIMHDGDVVRCWEWYLRGAIGRVPS